MSNLSLRVDEIKNYVRRGMPEGIEPIARELNVLFGRIDELERALIPFAKQARIENDGKPLVYVYKSDCETAYKTLSKEVARAALPPEPEYLPAE